MQKYRPDFIVRVKRGNFLVLETKEQDTQRDKTKREFFNEWTKTINEHGLFGKWQWSVSKNPAGVSEILKKAVRS